MKNPELKNLTDYSPEDKPWDERRSFSDDVGGIYLRAAGFEHYGEGEKRLSAHPHLTRG
jgi:hypothetical protein